MERFLYTIAMILVYATTPVFAQKSTTLEEYLTLAKENSPLLNDYNNQRYSLKIDSLKLRADYGIQVTGMGDLSGAPLIHNWGYNGGTLNSGRNLDAVVRISKDLLGNKNLDTRLAKYSLEMKHLINQSGISKVQLCKAVTEQYINTYSTQQQYAVAQEVVQLLEQEDFILKELTRKATFKQTDYLSFKVTLQQKLLALQQQYADWQNNYATLNYLVGRVDTTLHHLQPPLLQTGQPAPFNQSLYAESYKIDSLKLMNEARIINYDYQPKLSLYVDGGYSSALTATPYKNFGTSAGISLTVPIYDGNKRKKALQQNRLAQNTRKDYNDFEHQQYQQQAAQLEGQIRQYKQMLATAKEQLKYAQALIKANLEQLPTGDVKVADFILSINNYINLKSGLVQYETTLNNLYNQLQNLTL
mgnify:CR=1 FL=1